MSAGVGAIGRDAVSQADTATRRVDLVLGPKVILISPVAADSVPAGVGLTATARAAHGDGIG